MTDARRPSRAANRLDQPRVPRRMRLPQPSSEAFGKSAEAIARFMGTARFLVYMTVVIVLWIAWNTLAPPSLQFDPYTFTFLTLVLSLQASYAAPLILLAQNRQADRDRVALEEDRRRAAMQKADTEYLSREIAALRMALGEVATRDFLRSERGRLVVDVAGATGRGQQQAAKEHKRHQRQAARRADAIGFDELDEPFDPDETEDLEPVDPPDDTHTPRAPRGRARDV